MKKFRKLAVYLALGLSVAALAAGCKKKPKETESETEELTGTAIMDTEIEVQTGTTGNRTKLYTARDKSFSIVLPNSTWKNTKDVEDTLVFEAKEGSITITHLSGSGVSSVKLPETKEEVLGNFTAAGKDAEKYEVMEFEKTSAGSTDKYHTVIKCSDEDEDYVYSVGYDIAGSEEIYSVTGLVKEEDKDVLEAVKTAVESFKVLGKAVTGGTTSGSTTGQQSSGQQGDGSQTGASKVIYDSNGNPITVTKNANGTWSDSTGKTYDMQQYGVMGSDGYWYTYSAPSTGGSSTDNGDSNDGSHNDGNDNNNNNNDDGNNTPTAETSGFYDQDGNYVSVTKDANGNWVDTYGTVYYFGDSGVTDNAGNYYPYKDSSESTGFYDSQGNYITVTKNSNGEWVDSSGAKYTFGETGVTDEAGNFYPY